MICRHKLLQAMPEHQSELPNRRAAIRPAHDFIICMHKKRCARV